jgi:DNA polymerase III alpha subunit
VKLAYDLHIHTALSPCADDDMTPNNIVNMSILKGLDVIAITDHNSCRNVRACMACAANTQLLVIPGMEVETAEEIHVVCLFPNLERALEMQKLVYSRLPDISNNEAVFGKQLIINENDEVLHKETRLLLTSAAISINELFDAVNKNFKGVAIPAHIDRQANSLLSSFGVMPEDIKISSVEVSDKNKEVLLSERHYSLKNMRKIYSSDAHYLGNISERKNFIEVDKRCIKSVLSLLSGG